MSTSEFRGWAANDSIEVASIELDDGTRYTTTHHGVDAIYLDNYHVWVIQRQGRVFFPLSRLREARAS
jgi:hypothetical protein